MPVSLSKSGNISSSKDRLISLLRSMPIALEDCFSNLVAMQLGSRASPRLSVLITSSISFGDLGSRMQVLSIVV